MLRYSSPGGHRYDFAWDVAAPDMHGVLIQESDVYGNGAIYEHAVVQYPSVVGTVRLPKWAFINGTPRSIGSDRCEAVVEFFYHSALDTPELHGKLRKIQVERWLDVTRSLPDVSGGQFVPTQTVEYIYKQTEDSTDGFVTDFGRPGDLVQVQKAVRVDADRTDSQNVWYHTVTQYRYYGDGASPLLIDGEVLSGEPRQLRSVYGPEQIEYFADYLGRSQAQVLDARDGAAALGMLAENATTGLPAGNADDNWSVTHDIASKLIGYGSDDRVKRQYLRASTCGCSGGQSGSGLQRIDHVWHEYTWGDGSDGRSLVEIEYLDDSGTQVPYRARYHDLKRLAGSTGAWSLFATATAEIASGQLDQMGMPVTGRIWATIREHDAQPLAGGLPNPHFKSLAARSTPASSTYTPLSVDLSSTVTAPGASIAGTGLVHKFGYTIGQSSQKVRQTTAAVSNGSGGTPITRWANAPLQGVREDLDVSSNGYSDDAAQDPTHPVVLAYGFHTGSQTKVAWVKSTQQLDTEDQNGPGGTADAYQLYDDRGRLVWVRTADHVLIYHAYDRDTGVLTRRVLDAAPGTGDVPSIDTADFGDISLAGWTINTDPLRSWHFAFENDLLGRKRSETGPDGITRFTRHEVRDEPDVFARGTKLYSVVDLPPKLTDNRFASALTISWHNAAGHPLRTSSYEPDSAGYDPTSGQYTLVEERTRSAALKLRSGTTYRRYVWHQIPSGLEDPLDWSYQVNWEFDSLGRTVSYIDALGALTRSHFDALDRLTRTQEGIAGDELTLQDTYRVYFDGEDVSPSAVGNGNQTLEIEFDGQGGSAGSRTVRHHFDWRDRRLASERELPPHTVFRYDNLDRVVDTASYSRASLNGGIPDPSVAVPDRTSYVRNYHSTNGHVFLAASAVDPTQPMAVGDAQTTSSNAFETHNWTDVTGRTIASGSSGAPMTKTVFDTVGRPTVRYITDGNGDPAPRTSGSHQAAASVDDDHVIEQTEYAYTAMGQPGAGRAKMIRYRRRPHFLSQQTTGALSAQDGVTTFSVPLYDEVGRPEHILEYGSNSSTLRTNTTAPTTFSAARDATNPALVWSTAYDAVGVVTDSIDPAGTAIRTVRDALGRPVALIEAASQIEAAHVFWDDQAGDWRIDWAAAGYGGGAASDADRVTTFALNADGAILKRTTHRGTSELSTVLYEYGVDTTTTGSLLASPRLLYRVAYPDPLTGMPSGVGATTASYVYNRLGQVLEMTDQNGTTHRYTYDQVGRRTDDKILTFAGGVDTAIDQISRSYDMNGRLESVLSFNGPTVVNGVSFSYDNSGTLQQLRQNPDGDPALSAAHVINFDYDLITGGAAGFGSVLRASSLQYPAQSSGVDSSVTTVYAAGIDSRIGRATGLDAPGWGGQLDELVRYAYLGLSGTARQWFPATDHELALDYSIASNAAAGSASGEYPCLDAFGRVLRHAWMNADASPQPAPHADLPDRTPLLAREYAYTKAGRITRDIDGRPLGVIEPDDWVYAYDPLDRLTQALRGINAPGLNADDLDILPGSERWSLDVAGNWSQHFVDSDSAWPVAWNPTQELEERQHNRRDHVLLQQRPKPHSQYQIISQPTYDDHGNLATNALAAGQNQQLRYVYDAWHRLVRVERWATGGGSFSVVENEFNGLGWLVKNRSDTASGVYDGLDEERIFMYTPDWRLVEEHVDRGLSGGIDSKAQYLWGRRHANDVIAKRIDRLADGTWDDPLAQYLYLSDGMHNTRAICGSDGSMYAGIDYAPYGSASLRYAADVDADGDIDPDDVTEFTTNYNSGSPLKPGAAGYNPRADLDGDGISGIGFDEVQEFLALHNQQGALAMPPVGWVGNSADLNGPDNHFGYGSYWQIVAGAVDGGTTGLSSARNRFMDHQLGRWLSPDPMGPIDGPNLYEYVRSNPIGQYDPAGLATEVITAAGINNWNQALNRGWGGFEDYVKLHLGLTNTRSYASRLGTVDVYRPGNDAQLAGGQYIRYPSSESYLDMEAYRMAVTNFGAGESCNWMQTCARPRVKVFLLQPKTTTTPNPNRCCRVDITVIASAFDSVPNQGIANWTTMHPPSRLAYWRKWTSDVQYIDTSRHPMIHAIAEETNHPHHSIKALLHVNFLMDIAPAIDADPSPMSINDWFEGGVFVPAADRQVRRAIQSGEFDRVFIGHSQGANIVMHMLNHSCSPRGISPGTDGH